MTCSWDLNKGRSQHSSLLTRQERIIAHQFLENASIQSGLIGSAVPKLLVILLQAFPVLAELLQAGLVDVAEAMEFSEDFVSNSKISGES